MFCHFIHQSCNSSFQLSRSDTCNQSCNFFSRKNIFFRNALAKFQQFTFKFRSDSIQNISGSNRSTVFNLAAPAGNIHFNLFKSVADPVNPAAVTGSGYNVINKFFKCLTGPFLFKFNHSAGAFCSNPVHQQFKSAVPEFFRIALSHSLLCTLYRNTQRQISGRINLRIGFSQQITHILFLCSAYILILGTHCSNHPAVFITVSSGNIRSGYHHQRFLPGGIEHLDILQIFQQSRMGGINQKNAQIRILEIFFHQFTAFNQILLFSKGACSR